MAPDSDKAPARSKQTPQNTRPVASTKPVSFVSFDGSSSSDAARKAVRKQAALSSAAARKATIAKKIAQQRDDEEQQRSGAEQSSGDRREGVKRKRSAEAAAGAGPWQAGISIIDSSPLPRATLIGTSSHGLSAYGRSDPAWGRDTAAAAAVAAAPPPPSRRPAARPALPRQQPPPPSTTTTTRTLPKPSYTRPPSPPIEDTDIIDLRRNVHGQPQTAWLLSSGHEAPQAYSRQIIPLNVRRGWPVLAEDHDHNRNYDYDYDNNEEDQIESYIPMTPESLASPQTHSASIMDPFNQYPVPYHPIYDRLLHYMLTIFAPRGWSSLKISDREGLAYEGFMTQHALSEPALFLVRLLFASGDLINQGVLDRRVAMALRTLAIQAINDALSDPKRCTSDGLILAVGRIALTETLYGDKSAANTHRPAQRRMISLRGGMNALDFPPLIKRLMRWSDRVMSIQTNTPRLLLDDEDRGNTTLSMGDSLNLIENWAPQEGKAMRKKIAIADLIT